MKYLLITSDDFGMTHGVNAGVEDALLRGLVGATNLMVPCPWFADAARRVKEHDLPAGIHLTLTCEWDLYRWGPLTACESLKAPDGRLHSTFASIPASLTRAEIRAEFDAQLAVLREHGIEPTHADTHMIASMSGAPMELRVKSVVEEMCADEGLIYTYSTHTDGSLRHFTSETMFSPVAVDELKEILQGLGEGVHHVISHCAVDGDDLRTMSSTGDPWARQFRVKDHAALTSQEMRDYVAELGFEVLEMRQFLKMLAAGQAPR
jgi:predicted glycoside hydrolase/deacetylase ChbG (UPF0249 family)